MTNFFDDLDDSGMDESYQGTITGLVFEVGKYDFQAKVVTKYDEPRVKGDGTLSVERTEFIKVAGPDQGFVASDDGTSYVNKEGKKPKSNSGWGKFLTRLVELNGGKAPESIVGLRVRWDLEGEGKDYKFTDKATGEVKEGKSKGKNQPVEILGGGEPKMFDFQPLRDAGMTAVMESDLATIAKGSDIAGFRAQALDVPGFMDVKPLVGALGNQELYQALRDQ